MEKAEHLTSDGGHQPVHPADRQPSPVDVLDEVVVCASDSMWGWALHHSGDDVVLVESAEVYPPCQDRLVVEAWT